ncbi:uncharacterized protein LOC106440808 isoform X1 [Brassica napus]|uniref:uncharacterized protein LOC106440808 isoform X1 n=1 Tax=Brassica napus TaxID=3708 RepID=UPI0006AB29B8|nr:uncharacterized protein LOC106440808 isoform X1 [Brassica napus]
MATSLPSTSGGGSCCVLGSWVCFLRLLCSFCWQQDSSVHCHEHLHSSDYIAASDPADRGVFRSKKYLKVPENGKLPQSKDTKDGCGSTKSHNSMCT